MSTTAATSPAAGQQGFFELDATELEAWCAARGMPRFAAKQLLDWVYRKGIADPAQMTNLSLVQRQMLAREMVFLQGTELRTLEATDGTQKLLIGWPALGERTKDERRSTKEERHFLTSSFVVIRHSSGGASYSPVSIST